MSDERVEYVPVKLSDGTYAYRLKGEDATIGPDTKCRVEFYTASYKPDRLGVDGDLGGDEA